jgi:hypothetical protein
MQQLTVPLQLQLLTQLDSPGAQTAAVPSQSPAALLSPLDATKHRTKRPMRRRRRVTEFVISVSPYRSYYYGNVARDVKSVLWDTT